MQSNKAALLALVVFLGAVSFVQPLFAQTSPPIDPAYRKYLLYYDDKRSVPEKLVNEVGLTTQDVGRSFAMIVGVAKYPHLSDANHLLEPANRDVGILFDYLKNQQLFDEIVVLRDDDVTFGNLQYFLETYFPKQLRDSPHSRFIFAYSGHGMTERKHGFLLTGAARSLSDKQNSIDMDILRVFIEQTVEAGYQSLILINACHSGAFAGHQAEGPWDYMLKRPGAHAILSAGPQDASWGENDKGSYFYQKFIQGLNGDADSRGDGIITVADLGAYLQREVSLATSGRQVPTLPQDISPGVSDGGVFFFNRAKAVRIADLPEWNPGRLVPYGSEDLRTSTADSSAADARSPRQKRDVNANPHPSTLPSPKSHSKTSNWAGTFSHILSLSNGMTAWVLEINDTSAKIEMSYREGSPGGLAKCESHWSGQLAPTDSKDKLTYTATSTRLDCEGTEHSVVIKGEVSKTKDGQLLVSSSNNEWDGEKLSRVNEKE